MTHDPSETPKGKTIRRYQPEGPMKELSAGGYVLYSDHLADRAALQSRLDRAMELVEKAHKYMDLYPLSDRAVSDWLTDEQALKKEISNGP